ncbi:hypothetical protein Neosp_002935 [[Neocosmospora] mangrovei]
MEVVGVVAAIPGLIEIVQGLTTAVQGLAKRKVATRTAEELCLQLKDLEETLRDLQKRWRQNPLGQSQLQRLSPALAQLRLELSSIKDKLQSSKITKDPARFFRKAIFLTTSLEKTLKESLTRLTQAKTSLTLILAHHHDKQAEVKSIAERLKDQGEIALHFSFWAGSETQRKLLDLLRTILWQLLSHLPDVKFQQLSTPLVTEPSLNERNVLDVIHKALRLVQSDIYCIIDGIDESTDDWASRGDKCLQAVFALVEQHPKIHLLISGREPTMRTLLRESPPNIEVTESLIQQDMRRFIAVELQNALTIQNAEIEELVRTTLEAKSQIMFLWATLVFKELRRCYSIREIKKTLSQVPRDLDREYHRLFQHLMDRTGGTLTKPSISMKRARGILSTILACPEPLTAGELCYAYAAQENTSEAIEDDLIAVEGIADSCGDFLRVTEGRYHLVHTSTADFLTRPTDEWRDEDSDIEYFRVDPGDAQQSMCSACLRYMEILDWGYPLTDNGARDLPSKYPFFLYSTKFLPYHFTKALKLGRESWANSYLAQFAGTRQACLLVEYAASTVQNGLEGDEMGEFLYWFELMNAGIDLPTSQFIHAYENELTHRRHQFGSTDGRYESWKALSLLFPEDLLRKRDFHPLIGLKKPDKLVSGIRETPFHALPDYLAQPQNLGLQKVSQKAQTLSNALRGFRETTTDLMALSMDSLPAPMIFLGEAFAAFREDWPMAKRLATISRRKSRGKGDLFEAASLLDIATGTFSQDDNGWGDVDDILWQALGILDQLPPKPQVHFYKVRALSYLTCSLVYEGKEASREVACRLRDLIGKERKKTSNHIWEYLLCNTAYGIKWRILWLHLVAEQYLGVENNAEAASWAGEALAVGKGSKDTMCLDLLLIQRDAFYNLNDTQRCVTACLKILDFLEPLGRDQEEQKSDRPIQRATQLCIAISFAIQGDLEKARFWYCKAADDAISLPTDEQHPFYTEDIDDLPKLATDLALVGEYERSELICLKFLQLRKCSHDERRTKDFQKLGPMVDKLGRLGSIQLDNQRLLQCFSLLKPCFLLLWEIEGPMDLDKEIAWWGSCARDLKDHVVPNFRQNWTLFCLKRIDSELSQDDDLEEAFDWYKDLGEYYYKVGDVAAAEMVLRDAISRSLADLSCPFSWGLTMASTIFLYQRRFHQRRVLLLSANEAWKNSAPDLWSVFSREASFAIKFTEDAELLGKSDVSSDLQVSFVQQAYEHLMKARDANDHLEDGDPDDLDEDATEEQKDRHETIIDLEDRLRSLGSETLPPQIADGNQEATKGNRTLRRVKSLLLPGTSGSLKRRLSLDLY